MDELEKYIKLAYEDVDNVNRSAKKITSRFEKIERVELEIDNQITVTVEIIDDQDKLP